MFKKVLILSALLFTAIKQIIGNRVSQVLVATDIIITIFAYLFKPRQWDCCYDFSDEPTYYKILSYLDSPSLSVANFIYHSINPLLSSSFSEEWLTRIFMLIFIFCSSVQWALIGYLIWKIWKSVNQKML